MNLIQHYCTVQIRVYITLIVHSGFLTLCSCFYITPLNLKPVCHTRCTSPGCDSEHTWQVHALHECLNHTLFSLKWRLKASFSHYTSGCSIDIGDCLRILCRNVSFVFPTHGEVKMCGGYRLCLCLPAGIFTKLNEISNTPSPDENEQDSVSLCARAY